MNFPLFASTPKLILAEATENTAQEVDLSLGLTLLEAVALIKGSLFLKMACY